MKDYRSNDGELDLQDENELYDSIDTGAGRKEKIKSKIRFTRFLLLLIASVSALIVLFVNKDKLNIDNFRRLAAKVDIGLSTDESTDNSVIDFDYNKTGVVGVFKDGIARITGDSLVIMDNVGTQFQSVLTGFNSPALVTSNRYVLAYDRGGNRLIVTNSFTVVFDTTFEDNIVLASMNNNGYIAVVTESDAYKNKVIVYNSSFDEIYKINSMTRYILAANISNDNKSLALSSYYIKDSNIIPQINYYKFSEPEEVWSSDFNDDVAVQVLSKDDGCVVGLFGWGVSILSSRGEEKFKLEFGDRILQACCINYGRYNAVTMSSSLSGKSKITVFDDNGKTISEISTEDTAVSIDISSDRLAVLSRDMLYIYTVTGKLIDQRENTNNATKVLFSDKNSALVVSESNVVYNLIN